jgi:DNA-binding beta-propeller fold protein YncE
VLSRRSFALSGLAAIASAAACRRKPTVGYDIYVANQAGNAIAVVDLTAFALTKHIRLGESPTSVIADAKSPRVYALAPQSGTVYEIDTDRLAISRKVSLGPAIGMRRRGNSLWVLEKQAITEVPLDTLQRGATIKLPAEAHEFDLSPATNLAVVSHGPAGSLSIVDFESKSAKPPVKVADALGSVVFRYDGKGVLAADVGGNHLCVMTHEAEMIVKLPLAVRPENLCFNDDGGQLFITGAGPDAVVVVFPYYVAQVAETVLAGHAPGAMAVSGTHLFVTNPKAGDVSILNIARRKIEAVTAVGADPGFVTVTPDGNFALVLNRASGDMAVIRAGAIVAEAAGRLRSAPLYTMIPVGSRPVSAAVRQV